MFPNANFIAGISYNQYLKSITSTFMDLGKFFYQNKNVILVNLSSIDFYSLVIVKI